MLKSDSKPTSLLDIPRCLLVFHQAIKSERTRQNYSYYLGKFVEFAKHRIPDTTIDSLSKIPQEQGQVLLEDYLFYLSKKKIASKTIKTMIDPLKLFFEMNDRIFNWTKIRKMIPEDTVFIKDEPHTKETIIEMLSNMTSIENKALLMVLASSGCRVGMVEYLRICDLKPMSDNCQCMTVYARTKDSYSTFITFEAFEYIQRWLEKRKTRGEKITNDSLIFPRTSNDYSVYFSMLHRRLGLSEKITDRRRKIKALHGLRKRFDTILKSNIGVNPSLAERLMGHSVSIRLDNAYFRPSEQSLFETYQKIISDLIIDDRYQLKDEIAQKDEQIKSLQNDKDLKIKELEQKLEVISHHILNLSNKA